MPRFISFYQIVVALVVASVARGCYYWYWLESPNDYVFRRCQAGCGQALKESDSNYYECCMPMSSGAPTPSVCSSLIAANSGAAATCKSTSVSTTDMPSSYYTTHSTPPVPPTPAAPTGPSSQNGPPTGGGKLPPSQNGPPTGVPKTSSANAQPTSLDGINTGCPTTWVTQTSTKPCPTSSAAAIPTSEDCVCPTSSANAIPTSQAPVGALPPNGFGGDRRKRNTPPCVCPTSSAAAVPTSVCVCPTSSANAIPTSMITQAPVGAPAPDDFKGDRRKRNTAPEPSCSCTVPAAPVGALPPDGATFEKRAPEISLVTVAHAQRSARALPPADFVPDKRPGEKKDITLHSTAPATITHHLLARNTPTSCTSTVTSTTSITVDCTATAAANATAPVTTPASTTNSSIVSPSSASSIASTLSPVSVPSSASSSPATKSANAQPTTIPSAASSATTTTINSIVATTHVTSSDCDSTTIQPPPQKPSTSPDSHPVGAAAPSGDYNVD